MRRTCVALAGLLLLVAGLTGLLPASGSKLEPSRPTATDTEPADWVCTFSIVAYDPDRKEWGVAVASKYLAVGSVVPFARAGVGAIATQSAVNTTYGSRGLDLLADGKTAEEALKSLLEADGGRDSRQVAMIDAKGNIAQHTGKKCIVWAGHKAGKNYACQGNLLTGAEVVDKMAKAFEEAKGPLAWRMMDALQAGEEAGGDKRGKQSAAILIVRDKGGANGFNDRALDFRVDDHERPIQELARILALRLRRPEK